MVDFRSKWLRSRLNLWDYEGELPNVEAGVSVPRIIHQTFSSKQLPRDLSKNVANLRALNSEWEYRFYDDAVIAEFVEARYGRKVLELYNRINPHYGAARADLFRYLLLYQFGGVYLDIKSITRRPLRLSVQEDDCYVLSHWSNRPHGPRAGYGMHPELGAKGEFQQWHIIAAAGHPFLRRVIARVLRNIEEYVPYLDGVARRGILRVTGPVAYTLAINQILDRHPHRIVDLEGGLGLLYSLYPGDQQHYSLFTEHYTASTAPVISLTGARGAFDLPFALHRRAFAYCLQLVKRQRRKRTLGI